MDVMPRLFRRNTDEPVAEANMLPVMNIMFLLIPALLLSMEVASLAAIAVTPPRFTQSPASDPIEKPDNPNSLRVRVYEDGFGVELKGGRDEPDGTSATTGPTIPLAQPGAAIDDATRWNYAALQARVAQLRPLLDEGANLEISAEPQISMQVLVSTIDASQDPEHPLPLIVSESF
jgi:hypothetical protein